MPTIWERIRKGMLAEVNKQSFPIRTLFFAALNTKWAIVQATGSENFVTNMIDNVAFSKARELVGGRLRLTLTGGAGISDETHRFLSMVMCYVISGYGLTEVCGVAAVTMPRMGHRLRTVGPPVSFALSGSIDLVVLLRHPFLNDLTNSSHFIHLTNRHLAWS